MFKVLRIRESGLLRSTQDIYILCLLRAQGISQMSEKKENLKMEGRAANCYLLASYGNSIDEITIPTIAYIEFSRARSIREGL